MARKAPDTARVVIHVDVDCFYAQVEENRNPALRGKPLAVTQKYLCVTTNYAARARGVAKMMGLKDAVAQCPELQLVSGEDLTPYRAASKQILGVLAEFGTVERLGMDEAIVDVTLAVSRSAGSCTGRKPPSWRGHVFRGSGEQLQAESYRRPMDLRDTSSGSLGDGSAAEPADDAEARLAHGSAVADALRRAIRERVGYACSCGIAHNKLLAKICCGLHKPDAQTSLPATFAADLMAGLPVRVIGGVGYKTQRVLAELGVRTVEELRAVVMAGGGSGSGQLAAAVGPKLAVVLAEACWGRDASPVTPKGPAKSLTVEDSFKTCKSYAEVKRILEKLAPDLLQRIREEASGTGNRTA
jgi:DNA polymerase iota